MKRKTQVRKEKKKKKRIESEITPKKANDKEEANKEPKKDPGLKKKLRTGRKGKRTQYHPKRLNLEQS